MIIEKLYFQLIAGILIILVSLVIQFGSNFYELVVIFLYDLKNNMLMVKHSINKTLNLIFVVHLNCS